MPDGAGNIDHALHVGLHVELALAVRHLDAHLVPVCSQGWVRPPGPPHRALCQAGLDVWHALIVSSEDFAPRVYHPVCDPALVPIWLGLHIP